MDFDLFLSGLGGFFAILSVTEQGDKNGRHADNFVEQAADGTAGQLVDKPAGRDDEAEQTDGTRGADEETDGLRNSCNDGQRFETHGERRALHAEDEKGKHIRTDGKQGKGNRPSLAVCMKDFSVGKDKSAERAYQIENGTGHGAEHKEIDGKEKTTETLHQNDVPGRLALEGKNTDADGREADTLRCDLHVIPPFRTCPDGTRKSIPSDAGDVNNFFTIVTFTILHLRNPWFCAIMSP